MSDKFAPISMESLTKWIFTELEEKQSIFGIHDSLFFRPSESDKFKTEIYGNKLDTPFGVAAGPHSQMAQNIIVSWLCGGRFIELKTIQTLDELEVSKPCIDMQDVGYNVEWSQELKIKQSFDEYLRAWVLIHALHKKFNFPGETPGMIYSTSVGYNLEGILKPNVQWFLEKIRNAGGQLAEYIEIVSKYCPEVKNINIPSELSNNITLSTMHGCPPSEIGKIASYLIEELGFHTNVKLNPTLLGPVELRNIINNELGYRNIEIPDIAFEHDLKYPDALVILNDLQAKADKKGVIFGVKLSNTLEVVNKRNVFNKNEKMMYLSGRPLHGATVNLARKLSNELKGKILISYAGGADCFNVAELLRCGMKTITVSSDILRPGGYSRLVQYIENTNRAFNEIGASSTEDFIYKTAEKVSGKTVSQNNDSLIESKLINLNQYADYVLSDPLLFRDTFERDHSKTSRGLGLFDCIKAPCTDECPIQQKVPQYLEKAAEHKIEEGVDIIREDNPIPTILGRSCNHQCETTCTRTHYDEPLAIREIKRYLTETSKGYHNKVAIADKNVNVAVIGSGPCGLSAAYFLSQKGYNVTVFEEHKAPAGMVNETIPLYRSTTESIILDMKAFEDLGVKFVYGTKIGKDVTINALKEKGFKHIVIAVGAVKGMNLGIPGDDSLGVIDGITFLRAARENKKIELGGAVGVIGAGDVAMDCARTAARLTGGKVTVIYRRTVEEMPAHKEELDSLLEENIEIIELTAPKSVIIKNSRAVGLKCVKMQLGTPDSSGRRAPIEIENSEFEMPLDTIIAAIGQKPDFEFLKELPVEFNKKGYIKTEPETLKTSIDGIYAGGDAIENGPLTIVKACADGKKISNAINTVETSINAGYEEYIPENVDYNEYMKKRSKRKFRVPVDEQPIENRDNFNEIIFTLTDDLAKEEAERCLKCHNVCSTCTTVCPNRAIFTFKAEPFTCNVPSVSIVGSHSKTNGFTKMNIEQFFQTAIFTSFCNECGNCAIFCPTAGKPYADKPRFYTNDGEFNGEKNNAFMVSCEGNLPTISAKFDNVLHKLSIKDDIECTDGNINVKLSKDTFSLISGDCKTEIYEKPLTNFAIMYYLLKNMVSSMPELPGREQHS